MTAAAASARTATDPALVFYDGGCGLCHGFVKFLLRRDRGGTRFRFAPLGGKTLEERLDEAERQRLPDSVVVADADRWLTKSDAVLHLGRRLGGVWLGLAVVGGWVPRGLRDWAYDRVAAVRHRLFQKPDAACPVVPSEWRGRFLP
ncbi:MAG: DUF393 domain-containing protein [Planctomycetota bacterium]